MSLFLFFFFFYILIRTTHIYLIKSSFYSFFKCVCYFCVTIERNDTQKKNQFSKLNLFHDEQCFAMFSFIFHTFIANLTNIFSYIRNVFIQVFIFSVFYFYVSNTKYVFYGSEHKKHFFFSCWKKE